MWTYRVSDGSLFDDEQRRVAIGYSGRDVGKNKTEMERVKDVGPIPRGHYLICEPRDTDTHGPFVMPLEPDPANPPQLFGRSGFLIHGDSVKAPGTASHGCIILSRPAREAIWASNDHEITVI